MSIFLVQEGCLEGEAPRKLQEEGSGGGQSARESGREGGTSPSRHAGERVREEAWQSLDTL